MLLILGVVIEFIVLPQLAGARRSWHLITDVRPWFLILGVLLEFASLACYAELTRSLLPPAERPRRWTIQRIDMSTLAVSHLVPGGGAAGTAVAFQLFNGAGVPAQAAGFAVATQGIGSAVVLNVFLWLALVISIPVHGFDRLYVTAALLGALLLAGCAVGVLLLTRREAGAARFLRTLARRLPFVKEDVVHRAVHDASARLRNLASDRPLLARTLGWAAANWTLDAASLWVFLYAFGFRAGPIELVVAYGLANVLAAIPVTPGGLGIVEGVLVPTLVGFGASRGIAILGVVAWRLVNFWVPIPLGTACYVSLRAGAHASRRARREAVTGLVDAAEVGSRSARRSAHPAAATTEAGTDQT